MGNHTKNDIDVAQGPNMGFVDTIEVFKELYLDWLRFFRANMRCKWECPAACPLPGDCPELERVWNLWLDTLRAEERAMFN